MHPSYLKNGQWPVWLSFCKKITAGLLAALNGQLRTFKKTVIHDPLQPQASVSMLLVILLGHLPTLYVVYEMLMLCHVIGKTEMLQFKQWDAFWYASIAEHGYEYSTVKPSNSGFFPLFPYLWKLTGGGINLVCLCNALLFFAGMFMLKRTFDFSWAYFLLFVSIPSNMFMYVPYTEAAFFFFSSLLLAGLKLNDRRMIFAGLFFASLTRPAVAFFIPAIVVMEAGVYTNLKIFLRNCMHYMLPPLIGILFVLMFQYRVTGIWFAYFKAQSVFWKHSFQLPEFPLTTWGGPKILWLDGLAIFFGLLATLILLLCLAKRFSGKLMRVDKPTLFSLCYLAMALASVLFFNERDAAGGTSLMSANRYVLATPYFIMLLLFMAREVQFEKTYLVIYTLLRVSVFFLLRVDGGDFFTFNEQDKFYYRFLVILNILLFLLIARRWQGRFIPMIYLLNSVTQVALICKFSSGVWIG